MAKFDDLPNELLSQIIAILGEPSRPYGHRKGLSGLVSLCRTSKRLCDLARPEIYSAASFDYAFALTSYFQKSGINKVPAGTLVKLSIAPGEEDSFAMLGDEYYSTDEEEPGHAAVEKEEKEETDILEHIASCCTGVKYLGIYLCWQSSNMEDNFPEHYLPLFKALDPLSIIYDSGFSPTDMSYAHQGNPYIDLSELLDSFSSYTRLKYLFMSHVNFDRVDKGQLAILSRLPLEYLHFDWPSGLTAGKVFAILDALPKLRKNGLVISCHETSLSVEWIQTNGDFPPTTEDFMEQNAYLSIAEIETYLVAKGRTDLLEKLLWEVSEAERDEDGEIVAYRQYETDKIYDEIREEQMFA